MAGLVFVVFADIQHQRILVVDELQGGDGIHLFYAAKTIAEQRPQQHGAAEQGDGNRKKITADELHAGTPVLFGARILAERKNARDLSWPVRAAAGAVCHSRSRKTRWPAPVCF